MKAVLFDLDDTLFDHQYCYRAALQAIYDHFEPLRAKPFTDLETLYQNILETFHTQAVAGKISLEEARRLRIQAIFVDYGMDISLDDAQRIDETHYRHTYMKARRAVPGAQQLLATLRERELKIGIITNHVLTEQTDKLVAIGLTDYTDVVIAAGEVGVSKPDPHIFQILLDSLNCQPHDVVLVGDSWNADIIGAKRAGIRAIWLNRYEIPCPDPSLAKEIHALEPVEDVLKIIFDI